MAREREKELSKLKPDPKQEWKLWNAHGPCSSLWMVFFFHLSMVTLTTKHFYCCTRSVRLFFFVWCRRCPSLVTFFFFLSASTCVYSINETKKNIPFTYDELILKIERLFLCISHLSCDALHKQNEKKKKQRKLNNNALTLRELWMEPDWELENIFLVESHIVGTKHCSHLKGCDRKKRLMFASTASDD